jgi:hypothetical protein
VFQKRQKPAVSLLHEEDKMKTINYFIAPRARRMKKNKKVQIQNMNVNIIKIEF